jgi:hypothetical protein
MHDTTVAEAADAIHAHLKGLQAMSVMTASARESSQVFAKGAIQSQGNSGVERTFLPFDRLNTFSALSMSLASCTG